MRQVEEGVFEDDSIIPRKQQGDRLEPGVRIHDFMVGSVTGSQIVSSTYAQKKIWMAFYRYAGCPMCAAHFDEVMTYEKKLKDAGVVFFAIFDSAPAKVPERMKQKASPSCVIVGNDNMGMFELFGVEKSWSGLLSMGSVKARIEAGRKGYSENNLDGAINRMPAHILVWPGGEVAVAHYGKHAGDQIPWKTAWDFVAAKAPENKDGLTLA
ncbi:MAG: redoxin family protein [Bdellovibrionota bacterium]